VASGRSRQACKPTPAPTPHNGYAGSPRGERPTRYAGVTSERIAGATGNGRLDGLRVFANPAALHGATILQTGKGLAAG